MSNEGLRLPAKARWQMSRHLTFVVLISAAILPAFVSRKECAPMQAYDIFMLLVLVAAVIWGFWKGFAWQLASLASIALSYFVALNFRTPVAGMVTQATNAGPPWNIFLAMLILFLATALVVWISF